MQHSVHLITQVITERSFYLLQKDLLFPSVHEAWLNHQITVLAYLKDSPVKLSGDGRCDSPGFSAKYCTHTVMDQATSLIVDFSLVQVTECTSSVAMEKEGLKRCLKKVIPQLVGGPYLSN